MKKLLMVAVVLTIVASLVATPALAAKGDNPANDKAGKLYLYEKDANWDIVWDGAWGKLNYKLGGTTISGVFNGHGLEAKTDYSLVSYSDWPNVTVIASGTSNKGGNIHLAGSADLGSVSDWGDDGTGYKIWLIESGDIDDGTTINTWPLNGTVLWEHNLIP